MVLGGVGGNEATIASAGVAEESLEFIESGGIRPVAEGISVISQT